MDTDPYSALTPARVRVLVLPCGKITKRRFASFVDRLLQVSSVRLGDVSSESTTESSSFSPAAFPDGKVLLDVSCNAPPAAYSQFTSFEPFRGPLIIIGTIDALEYQDGAGHGGSPVSPSPSIFYQRAHDGFTSAMENAQDHYAGALLTQLLVMDSVKQDAAPWIPEQSLHLPSEEDSSAAAVMHVMCDVVGRFLEKVAALAGQMGSWDSIQTPVTPINQSQQINGDRRSSARMSVITQQSRDGAVTADALPWSHARQVSQAHVASSPAITESPRPDSPTSRSETPSSPDRASVPDTISGSEDFKQRQRFSRIVLPNALTTASPDKERNIGKARLGIALGTLHLMTGHWSDALKELVENTNKARSLHDYIWVAIGIERILVCLLLLGSEDFSFQVPTVCLLGSERQSSIPFIDSGRDAIPTVGARDQESGKASLRKLGSSIDDICHTIMTYHDRAGTYSGEALATLPYSELILRLTKLQSSLLAKYKALDIGVSLRPEQVEALWRQPGEKSRSSATRLTLCDNLFRVLPTPQVDLDAESRIALLAGMSSVLSILRMERKLAIVLKELVVVLVPPLQQARKLGAAELGIHPSSSLSHSNSMLLGTDQNGTKLAVGGLLTQLLSAYAVREPSTGKVLASKDPNASTLDLEQTFHDMMLPLVRAANLDHLGSLHLKLDVLRTSIDFCEAVPDLAGAAQNAALLLSIAGPQCPVDPTQRKAHVTLATDEQVRLASAIASIAGSARDSNTQALLPPYWDRFLVRNVTLAEIPGTGRLTEHRKADREADTSKSLFLYDPFTNKTAKQAKERTIVAGEASPIAVILQNPYDFEIKLEQVDFVLDTQDMQLVTEPVHVLLGPRRLQEILVMATPSRAGSLKILALRIKMAGCQEGIFSIHTEDWRLETDVKVKEAVKPAALPAALDRAVAGQSKALPKPFEVAVSVIPAQPVIVVESVSLKSRSLMLMEGERSSFCITLRNISKSVDADFVHVSFEDSLTSSLRESLTSKTLSRADLYQIELEMAQNPIFTWTRLDSDTSELIPAGSCATFEVTILGRVGIRDARVLFDFAHLKDMGEASTFYTRQLAVAVNVTVNTGVELQHFDIMRLAPALGLAEDMATSDRRHCLVILDLRNAGSSSVDVNLRIAAESDTSHQQDKTILPLQTVRFALPMQGIHVKNPSAQIPWLSSQNRRQFIVSSSGDIGEERSMREIFWYREELLKTLKGSWRDALCRRHGDMSFRSIALKQHHLDVLRAEDLDVQCNVILQTDEDGQMAVKQTGKASFDVKPRSFLALKVALWNRSDKAIHPMLRLLPMVANQNSESGLEVVSRRLVWSGALQQPVPMIEPGQCRTVEIGFCALSTGMYSIGVVVEEIRPAVARDDQKGESNDDDDLDEVGRRSEERRVWRAPDLCSIRAV